MTDRLPRLKPSPIPAIHPVPDYLADDRLRAVYDDTKAVLQVPWMGVVTMAFAHYRSFYDALWSGLRPLAESAAFAAACADLRRSAEAGAARLQPRALSGRLAEIGYAPRELDEIRDLLEVFSHGNMPYLMIATAARLLLEGHALSEDRAVAPAAHRHGPAPAGRLVLMEPHHAAAPTRALFEEVKGRLGLPFVNTDYRALARWPSYFALAWQDLTPVLAAPAYRDVVQSVHEAAVTNALSLPNPGRLAPADLAAAAGRDAPLAEILQVVRLFQWLLPGLAVNVACLRRQLDGGR